MKKKILFISLAAVSVVVAVFLWPRFSGFFNQDVYVALVGDMSPGSQIGEDTENGVRLCLDKINREGGINGRKIKLLVFDDKNDPKQAMKAASRIAERDDILMVIGHGWSRASSAAGKIYKKYGIPAITGSSMAPEVTRQSDWYFSAIPDSVFSGRYLASYVKKALGQSAVCLIVENSPYGKTLSESFEKAAQKLDLSINKRWGYSEGSVSLDEDFSKIASELRAVQDPGLICLMGTIDDTVQMISLLKGSGKEYVILSTDPLRRDSLDFFEKFPREKARPGYFSDGVYAFGIFSEHIAQKKAHDFMKDYMEQYGRKSGWGGAYYYDAASAAAEAMKRAEIQGKGHIRRDRREIKKALESMHSPETGIKGVMGRIYFDKNGVSNWPSQIGFYKNKKEFPSFTQYGLESGASSEEDAVAKALSGEIIFVGDRVMNRIRVVYSGIDINEISGPDIKASTFRADFYLWFRYKGDFKEGSDIVFPNAAGPVDLGDPEVRKEEGGVTRVRYHIKADFRADSDYRDYPFDRQTLKIAFRHKTLTRDSLIYIADALGFPDSQREDYKNSVNIKGRHVEGRFFEEQIIEKHSGEDMGEDGEDAVHYSQCEAKILLAKDPMGVVVRVFVPIFFFLAVLYAVYFIGADRALLRLVIPLFVIAAAAFYHVWTLLHLGIDYTTDLEYAYMGIYALAALGVAAVLAGRYYHGKKDLRKVRWVSYAGIIGHPALGLALFLRLLMG
jgi:branched-chain amino acid transport system substrate-binding protein